MDAKETKGLLQRKWKTTDSGDYCVQFLGAFALPNVLIRKQNNFIWINFYLSFT